MKSALNGATTMPYSLVKDIEAASAAGFEGLEIWRDKLRNFLQRESPAALKRRLDDAGLAAVAIGPLFMKCFTNDPEELELLERWAPAAAEIGCNVIVACLDEPPEDEERTFAVTRAAQAARRWAEIVQPLQLRIAIEPVGMHRLIPGPNEAMEIVRKADHEALGVTMDTFHYHKSRVTLGAIDNIPPDRLLLIHISDVPDMERSELTDGNRIYPGMGVIPLADMLRIARKNRYKGYLSVELFNERLWLRPPEEVAKEAKSRLDAVLGALGDS
jgi:sugar phosphate isomerase/epimerase